MEHLHPSSSQPHQQQSDSHTLPNRREALLGLIALAAAACGPRSDPNASTTPAPTPQPAPPSPPPPAPQPQPQPQPILPFSVPAQAPQTSEYSLIFGFNRLTDITNPGQEVEDYIVNQLKRGNRRIPIGLTGNVTPNGTDIALAGQAAVDANTFRNFIDMLIRIEDAGRLPRGFIRLTTYLRISVTTEDGGPPANPNSPGKVNLSDPTITANVQQLIRDLGEGNRFGFGERVRNENVGAIPNYRPEQSGVVIDAEDLLDDGFDTDDLLNPADANSARVSAIAQLIQGLGPRSFEVYVYTTGIIKPAWFPKATSPFGSSPRNLISPAGAQAIVNAGGRLALALYDRFPNDISTGGLDINDPANINTYGPFHRNYQTFVDEQFQELQRLGIPLEEQHFLLPAFIGSPSTPTPHEAIDATRNSINNLLSAPTRPIQLEVFESENVLPRPGIGIPGNPTVVTSILSNTR